jgi:hypothetical protein
MFTAEKRINRCSAILPSAIRQLNRALAKVDARHR